MIVVTTMLTVTMMTMTSFFFSKFLTMDICLGIFGVSHHGMLFSHEAVKDIPNHKMEDDLQAQVIHLFL